MNQKRIKKLNEEKVKEGNYVLYWMQQSQRTEYNHALQFAIEKAEELKLPVIVFFGLTENFPQANLRHYIFMLEGLKEVVDNLRNMGIKFIIQQIEPDKGVIKLSKKASILITDRGYLNIQRKWRYSVKSGINCPFYEVENDVVVPVEEVSTKEEYAAYTIRPKIKEKVDSFLVPLKNKVPSIESQEIKTRSLDLSHIGKIINSLNINNNVKPSPYYHGGTKRAKILLDEFIQNNLKDYSKYSNNPVKNVLSNMSPYLHFGQISPVYIALKIINENFDSSEDYLEQLIVRRELSMNFVHYNKNYDSLSSLPDWAIRTLDEHRNDKREYIYNLDEFENSQTHDNYWNAAQKEMVKTGKMHGYMRMYWGKKIIEWSKTPEDALKTAIYLNNKYELDGRDPNSYTGVLWCFGKHDRAWKERKIFGKVRYMSMNGLKRKFDMDKYLERVRNLDPV